MKLSIQAALALVALTASCVVPSMRADDAAPTAEAGPMKGEGHSRHRNPYANLNLSADQLKQVDGIQKDEKSGLDAVKADTNLSRTAKKAKSDEIRASHHGQIRALLTPEQQVKFDAMPAPGTRAAKEKQPQ